MDLCLSTFTIEIKNGLIISDCFSQAQISVIYTYGGIDVQVN
jgi:hypothetical protein